MAHSFKKIGGVVGKVIGVLPDAGEAIGKVVETSGHLIEKAMEQHHEHKKSLVFLPDIRDLNRQEAREHLENLGFVVTEVLAKPDKRWIKKIPDEVVKMYPKPAKIQSGSLVKIYYVNASIIEASKDGLVLPDVRGISLEEARHILTVAGFQVAEVLSQADKSYAHQRAGYVLSMSPQPSLLSQTLRKNSLIKLKYLDQAGLEESRLLWKQSKNKRGNMKEKIRSNVEELKKIF